MALDDELAAWLRLLLTPGLGRASARRLLAAFGSAEAVWAQPDPAWQAVLGRDAPAAPDGWDAQREAHARWLDTAGHHAIPLGDGRYPAALLESEDPPLLLFVLGDPAALNHPRRVAMVGSRNPTAQGADNAHAFAQALARAGVAVVSGLALGVDGAAHQGALAGAGLTVAVVGTGLDRVYPARHRDLAHRIVASGGAIVSEYPLGTPPLPAHFPQRNRLIAALGEATLVVEAALQSGSLITARLAGEMGREVMAIPGSIHAPQSRGCHALIRQGAKLVESANDVLEDLRWAAASTPATASEVTPQEPTDEDPLLTQLGHEPVSFDALQARTGLDTPTLQARLLDHELEGRVARLPGGLFQRRHAA